MNNKDKKKIAIVTWLFPKISETFILNQVTFLLDRGYEVKVFATKNATEIPPKEDLYVESNMHPSVLEYNLLKKTTYAIPSQLAKILKRESKTGNIDIIYFQFSDLASIVLEQEVFDVPIITIFHDLPRITKSNSQALKNKFHKAFEGATLVLAISEFAKAELLKLDCPLKKIIVHPMGADGKLFRPLKRKNISSRHIILTMIGRFVPKKGFATGIKSVSKFTQKHPEFKVSLNIVGDGYLRVKLEKLARKIDLQDVKFWGKLDQYGVIKILKETDIFICPSQTDSQGKREGLPVTLIEASLMGLPIVTTGNAAIPEIAFLSRSIVLSRERDVDDLTRCIEKIVKRYKHYSKLAKKDRECIAGRYDLNVLGMKLIHIFNHAIQINILHNTLKNLSNNLIKKLGSRLINVYIVGSIARLEKISKFSDLDMIVIVNKEKSMDRKFFSSLRKYFFELQKITGISVTPQIFSRSDFLRLVSPVLLKDYSIDGEDIIGGPILKKIDELPLKTLEFDILKRMLFKRYLMRQRIVLKGFTFDETYYLAKIALFLAKYFIWIGKRKYPTTKSDIVEIWSSSSIMKGTKNVLEIIENMIFDPTKANDKDMWIIINFIEGICNKATKILRIRYGKININTF